MTKMPFLPLPPSEKSCSCSGCQKACETRVGWFLPGEAEKTAEKMGMSLEEFFERYLAADYFEGKDREQRVYVLAPANVYTTSGEVLEVYIGRCIFFEQGLCKIHEFGKPYECKRDLHDIIQKKFVIDNHAAVAKAWATQENQDLIHRLLRVVKDRRRK